MTNKNFLLLFSLIGLAACTEPTKQEAKLPILGERTVETSRVNGKEVTDTVYHTVGDFTFLDQDSSRFTQAEVANKVYVTDFFFTSCPSICIPMAKQMLRIYAQYGSNPNFAILSHSLDPSYDRPAVLKQYAQGLGVEDNSSWHFLTTGQGTSDVYELGQTRYMVTARTDKSAPGGVLHSGAFILVDGQGRIRGMYDGTQPNAVDRLMADIAMLLPAEDKNK